jgi:hypothetical protein
MKLAIVVLAASAAAMSTAAATTPALAAKPPALATPAPASGTGLPTGQCFRSSDIRNHTIADRNTLLIDVRGKETYRITMKGACLAGAVSSDPIITRQPPGSSIICKPIDMDIAISRGGFPSHCIVDSIVKLSPEEVAALPRKLKP